MFSSLTTSPQNILFLLIAFHAFMDFALQTEWIATNKNPKVRLSFPENERKKMQVIWPHLLTAHAFHHGLAVFLVTQSLTLGLLETVIHWITDFSKCQGWIGFHSDQFIHIICKFLWTYLMWKQII